MTVDTKERIDVRKIIIGDMEKPTPLPSWLESHLIPDDWERLKGLLDGYRADNGLYRNIEAYADLAFNMFICSRINEMSWA